MESQQQKIKKIASINNSIEQHPIPSLSDSRQYSTMLWHHRLAHCNIEKIPTMQRHWIVDGLYSIPRTDSIHSMNCKGCALGKSTRAPFQQVSSRIPATRPLMRIFHDNSGAVNIPDEKTNSIRNWIKALGTEKYLSLIVDEYSGYLIGKPIYTKDQSVDHIIDTITLEENQTGHHVQIVNGDDSGEFRTARLLEFFRKKGIIRNTTTKGTPQHNAIVERAMRTVFNATRAILIHANLHYVFWGYAVLAAIYALNLLPTYRNERKSRTELFRRYKPSVGRLRVFGCDAIVNILKEDKNSKVEQNGILCIFIGYDQSRENGYLFFDPEQMRVITSRDAVFHEDRFSCGRDKIQTPKGVGELLLEEKKRDIVEDDGGTPIPATLSLGPGVVIEPENMPENKSSGNNNVVGVDSVVRMEDSISESKEINSNNPVFSISQPSPMNDEATRRSTRRRKHPDYLGDMIPSEILMSEEYHLVEEGPSNYTDAMSLPEAKQWQEACQAELDSHDKNQSWTLVKRTHDIHVIPSRWVLVVKIDPSNGKRKYKARFVVKGFRQVNGVDYFDDQISSSVLASKSLRIILAISVIEGHELHQMDAISAFTQSQLDQDVYAEQPEGFQKGQSLVCKLNKAVYGLKQASYLWQQDVKKFMIKLGFTPCILDDNLFFKRSITKRIILVGTYVDDILSSFHPEDQKEFMKFVDEMQNRFTLKVIGNPQSILGMKVEYEKGNKILSLSHRQYIEQLLSRHSMERAKSQPTPQTEEQLGPEHCPTMESERREMSQYPYRQMVGELLYLANTSRPDLSHCVGVLSRFVENPGRKHWDAAKRVLRYLEGSKDIGLIFNGNATVQKNQYLTTDGTIEINPPNLQYQLQAFSDADWGRDMHGRKSIYGYIIHLNGCPIGWTSKKQTFVAHSTCESEYVGMSEATRELRWIFQILQEMKMSVNVPILYGDNHSAISIASNKRMDNRIKSIDIKYHYIKDEVNSKRIDLRDVPSENNIADIFTKPLARIRFHRLRNLVMGYSVKEQNVD